MSPRSLPSASVLLEVRDLAVSFAACRGLLAPSALRIRAVDGIAFSVKGGETLGLVGESGSGKTTVARALVRLVEPRAGAVYLEGESVLDAPPRRLRSVRRRMQLVFQDSSSALNPRRTVGAVVSEALLLAGVTSRGERTERTAELLERTGLDPLRHLRAYPHELSGGQRQRVGIARAIAPRPRVLLCDEPVSALDVSTAAQILNLLGELQAEFRHGCLFISHDLSVVRHSSHRVAVMYLGRIVETGPVETLYAAPHHPYTRALLESAPARHPSERARAPAAEGEPPGPVRIPSGCRFHPRCPRVMDRCRWQDPPGVEVSSGHVSWCFLQP
jgi:oligopeptide/dipeptide ABC transporter ATP-binding protein